MRGSISREIFTFLTIWQSHLAERVGKRRLGVRVGDRHGDDPTDDNPPGQRGELAQCQLSADVKRFSPGYPHRAISANWPPVAKLSGKTACFGLLAHLVARRVCWSKFEIRRTKIWRRMEHGTNTDRPHPEMKSPFPGALCGVRRPAPSAPLLFLGSFRTSPNANQPYHFRKPLPARLLRTGSHGLQIRFLPKSRNNSLTICGILSTGRLLRVRLPLLS